MAKFRIRMGGVGKFSYSASRSTFDKPQVLTRELIGKIRPTTRPQEGNAIGASISQNLLTDQRFKSSIAIASSLWNTVGRKTKLIGSPAESINLPSLFNSRGAPSRHRLALPKTSSRIASACFECTRDIWPNRLMVAKDSLPRSGGRVALLTES